MAWIRRHAHPPRLLGNAGLLELVEPRIREVVVAALGVGPEDLAPGVSLRDDLAVDSLDLLELAVLLEGEFRIAIREAAIDDVRTYPDLVRTVVGCIAAAADGVREVVEPPPLVRTRVVAPAAATAMERATPLTPYAVEEIAEDALHAGPGAELDIVVASTGNDAVAGVERTFGWLRARGVALHVEADPSLAG